MSCTDYAIKFRRVALAFLATGFAFALLPAGSLAHLSTGKAWLPQGGFVTPDPLINGGQAVNLDGVTAQQQITLT